MRLADFIQGNMERSWLAGISLRASFQALARWAWKSFGTTKQILEGVCKDLSSPQTREAQDLKGRVLAPPPVDA
jgi:hypothetical protein